MNKKNIMKDQKNIEVAVRMRPLLDQFEDQEAWSIDSHKNTVQSISNSINDSLALNNITNLSTNSSHNGTSVFKKNIQPFQRGNNFIGNGVQKNNQYQFTCDYAFGPNHSNHEIYDDCCYKIIKQFVQEQKNGTIFMYGQTTSGKTFTMLGDNETQGLIIFSLKDIFDKLYGNKSSKICISYFQIYNEQITDLLKPGSANLKIVEDKVYGAEEIAVENLHSAIQLLRIGEEQRKYSEKNYHDHSSRSHTIFEIKRIDAKRGSIKAVLNLVDLAGSQRLVNEDSNEQTGFINKSLFVLSNVIHRLASAKKNTHIPFRDSKLTRILGPSLTGSSSTIVICTISPASINFYQTLSTLRFASCSRKVKLKPKNSNTNTSSDSRDESSILESLQMAKLKEQNQDLKRRLKLNNFDIKSKENNFLQEKIKKLTQHLYLNDSSTFENIEQNTEAWSDKVMMLCNQYNKNVKTLQKQYTKAMINAIAVECEIDREKLAWALADFQ